MLFSYYQLYVLSTTLTILASEGCLLSRRPSLPAAVVWLSLGVSGWTPSVLALPIGFGINQGSIEYNETKNDHFYIYHDRRSPTEGPIALEALDSARPHLERWFDVGRDRALPVIVSDVTNNASFANLITDALEVQTGGFAPRDLFLHEYVHSTMYQRFGLLIGPPQTVLHMAWMPEWFIEGLSEAITVSVGSDVQAGIERYHALSGDWPTYDRLHSLYGSVNFFPRGYAISGGLVAYILRHGDANRLPRLMQEFYDFTMPWYWFWAAVPFNGFMPMDRVLENYGKHSGRSFYERYKKDAATFWKAKSPSPLWVSRPGAKRSFGGFYGMRSVGAELRLQVFVDNRMEDQSLIAGKSGWIEGTRKVTQLPSDFKSGIGFFNKDLQVTVDNDRDVQGIEIPMVKIRQIDGKVIRTSRMPTKGLVNDVWDTPEAILWWEQDLTRTSICYLLKRDLKLAKRRPTCSLTLEQPKSLEFLGARTTSLPNRDVLAKELWFNIVEQTLTGDRSQILIFDATERRMRTIETAAVGRPIQAAFAGSGIWLLTAERGGRTIRKIEGDGKCIGMVSPSDHILALWGHSDGGLSLGLFAGQSRFVLRQTADSLGLTPCKTPTLHTSPLMAAMGSKIPLGLPEAMEKASYWQLDRDNKGGVDTAVVKSSLAKNTVAMTAPVNPAEATAKQDLQAVAEAKPLGDGVKDTDATSGEAKWRGRPAIVGVPWIGGEDARGPQIGIISVPLMDHLQNDTVRATFLFGAYSNFYPNTEISYLNTHFWPTLKFDVFRAQTFNGIGTRRNKAGELESEVLYFDEKGVRSSIIWEWLNNGTTFELGLKASNLEPYLGSKNVRQGNVRELHGAVSHVRSLPARITWSNSLFANDVPHGINESFDYNQVGFRTGFSRNFSFLSSLLSLGLEGSRTRGQKPRFLQEYYQPLKTFVPGSGGGSNKQSGPIVGTGPLFSSIYGDTQGRFSANWVIPIIPDFDKLVWIFYIDRLDFTTFFNFGGAWNQRSYPYRDELVPAHGYNLDLLFNIKNIRLNVGTGAGQVFGNGVQVYWTGGFDAVF